MAIKFVKKYQYLEIEWIQIEEGLLEIISLTKNPLKYWDLDFKNYQELILYLIKILDIQSLRNIQKKYRDKISEEDVIKTYLSTIHQNCKEIKKLTKLLSLKVNTREK